MATNFQWRGPQVTRAIEQRTERLVTAACILVTTEAKRIVSRPGTLNRKGKRRVYGYIRSKPGEPPMKQYGHLRRSITYRIDKLLGRVGTPLRKGLDLEIGTRKMRPRPWLRRSLRARIPQIRALMRQIGGRR